MSGADADLLVVGGECGGVAAALTALRLGLRVLLTEETDWLGGQLTAQAVPPDEKAWIEGPHASPGYTDFRRRVRAYYRCNYPLTPAAAAGPPAGSGARDRQPASATSRASRRR